MRELCTTVSNVGNDKSKKYASHAIAPCVTKHFLNTFVIRRLKFPVNSSRKIIPQRRIIQTEAVCLE